MQIQEGFLFGCAFHAWFYSCELKRCGNSYLFSFRQRLEVLTLKYYQDKMIKLHRFWLESEYKRISWAGRHKDNWVQLLDVQNGVGWKEPGFQMMSWQQRLFSILEAWHALVNVPELFQAHLGFQHLSDCRVWRKRKCSKVLRDILKMVFPIPKENENYVAEA